MEKVYAGFDANGNVTGGKFIKKKLLFSRYCLFFNCIVHFFKTFIHIIKTLVTGRWCNYEETDESSRLRQECSTTLRNYTDSLSLSCDPGRGGVLTWTPDDNTPDLVYYQVKL